MSDVLAWHFVGDTLRDGRPIPLAGVTLRHDAPLVLCESGLHASVRALDALDYAPGPTVCRVRCGGEIVTDQDKLVAAERTILWRADVTDLLREFARLCALDVAHLWDCPDVVRTYLTTGDESLRDAAWDTARNAAWDTARAAAWAATRYGAWNGARAAAWNGAWDTARAMQNERLTGMLMAAAPS